MWDGGTAMEKKESRASSFDFSGFSYRDGGIYLVTDLGTKIFIAFPGHCQGFPYIT